jgi:glycine/D-amino acid oxidase-like deaminating enzyme
MAARDVKRIPVHNGPAAWSAILGIAPPRAALKGEIACDVAIVGAGFAGLSAARRLLQLEPKSKIVILDAGQVAEGGAGRNSGFMIDLPHELTSSDYAGGGESIDRVMTRLNRSAIDFAGEAVREYQIPAGYFQRSGKINGAASEVGLQHNKSYSEHLKSLNEVHELLDARAMKEITGTSYYSGGLYTPGTAMLQPAGYVRGLASGLEGEGVTIFELSPVIRFEAAAPGWRLFTRNGRLDAQKVILANNGHLESFGFKQGRLMHIMLNACMTEEIPEVKLKELGGRDCWGITPADSMGTTVRRISTAQGGNRIVIRQGGYYRPNMKTSAADLKRLVHRMREKFDARFPMLKEVKFDYSWSGHLCLTKNAVSVLRELEPGLFAACVENGLGTARGTLTSIGAAELSCGRTSAITDFFTAQAEPTRLPPHPFDTIGANAYMRWKEWQARLE